MLTGKRSHQLFLDCVPDFAVICSAVSCSSCRVARSRENLLVDIDLSSSSYDKSVQTSKSKFFHKRIFFHLERPSNSGSTRQGLCLAQHSCIKQAYLLNTGPLKIRRNQILEFSKRYLRRTVLSAHLSLDFQKRPSSTASMSACNSAKSKNFCRSTSLPDSKGTLGSHFVFRTTGNISLMIGIIRKMVYALGELVHQALDAPGVISLHSGAFHRAMICSRAT
ncbi:hypothetical protein T08_4850 [Trichinella sp. T8]|nr:hypothetical protein T08_4850 [Trichinella sp. T8]